ncbi:MAG: hypothetical protein AAB071_03600 [Bacteroidota bacterium]
MDLETRFLHLKEEAEKRIIINGFTDFLRTQKIELKFIRGNSYTSGGKIIGVGIGIERMPRQWLINLPDDEYTTIALLCEDSKKNVTRFILSEKFFDKIKERISRDSNKQLKFTVLQERELHSLKFPNYQPIAISNFRDFTDEL